MTGVYGKLPSHGDFVRRGLPMSFVEPWDAWLQNTLGQVQDALGDRLATLWSAAPGWRFHLPRGACGPDAVVGVVLTSRDAVGRRFPLTIAATVATAAPGDDWYAQIEAAGVAARDGGSTADDLMSALPRPVPAAGGAAPAPGWWCPLRPRWAGARLPPAAQLQAWLEGRAPGRLAGASATHPGTVRSRNEDACIERADIGLWAVADGAGGHGAGDVASAAVIRALAGLASDLRAGEILAQARGRLLAVHDELHGMAGAGVSPATTVVVLMVRDDHFACLWAGDSRAYLLRDDHLQRITSDHSLVQELVDAGLLAAADAESHPQANVITRAIGSSVPLELGKVTGRVAPGDLLLLCTDGLFKAIPEPAIERALVDGAGPRQLIDLALQAGARDNVTALIVSVR